jgi:protein SCO1/2/putative membrane protein
VKNLPWILFTVVAACAVAGAVQLWLRRGPPRAPDFRLVERSGRTVSRRDLLGKVWVADFVFTRCQLTCPVMASAMDGLASKLPEVRFVSFSVDPSHDTPERLARWVATMGLSREGWDWLSGTSEEEVQAIARGFLLPVGRSGDERMEILHSEKFVLVDQYGRIRRQVPVVDGRTMGKRTEEILQLEEDARRLAGERYLPVTKLPAVNAGLNGASGLLLLVGFCFIRARRVGAHRACMLAALGSSTLFLVSYLTAHYYLGSTPYSGQGWMRTAYFGILLSHTVLAALIVPLAMVTVFRAFRADFERHRAIARWTFPLWLYVSVTGVVIYFMLY